MRFQGKEEFLQENNFVSTGYCISASSARKARLWDVCLIQKVDLLIKLLFELFIFKCPLKKSIIKIYG